MCSTVLYLATYAGPLSTAHKHEQKVTKEAIAIPRMPRRWGRSHSPLRQLLSAKSSSRTASPTRSSEVGKTTVQADIICGAVTVYFYKLSRSFTPVPCLATAYLRIVQGGMHKGLRKPYTSPPRHACESDVTYTDAAVLLLYVVN